MIVLRSKEKLGLEKLTAKYTIKAIRAKGINSESVPKIVIASMC